ncbi:hypothetical protein JCM5353_001515 [Sporobolomyces roseus]
MVATLAAQLAPLIGLDEQTVSEQILPHLESIKSQNEIKNYLQTLLAPGTKSQAFIQHYLSQRFSPAPSAQQSSKGWATPPLPSSRSTSQVRSGGGIYEREKRKEELQAAFEGGQGKVYRKGQEELSGGWGGGSSSSRGVGTRGMNETRASNSNTIPTSSSSTKQSTSTTKGKAKQSAPSTVILPSSSSSSSIKGLELSEQATQELIEIDRSLKSFKPLSPSQGGKTGRTCFCQARQHPLSPYIPLCKSCGLILCTLNPPSLLNCPSCSNSPLLPPKLFDSYLSDLTQRRTLLLDRAKIELSHKKEREELERKAIRFPELGADYRPQPSTGMGGGGGYAGHAGGGMGIQERIERAYEMGVSLNGRSMMEKKGGKDVGGKVLRLDGKGKVRVQTKRNVPSAGKKKEQVGAERASELVVEEPEEEDDGLVSLIDPSDDGISSNPSSSKSNLESTKRGRPFWNSSREEDDELMWVEREELSHSLLDQDQEGEMVESVPDTSRAERMRRVVVGAGEQVEESSSGRGKGTKGGKK